MIRPECHETQRLKLASGLVALGVTLACLGTGHDRWAGVAAAYAASLLMRPSERMAALLSVKPQGRMVGLVGFTAAGWIAEYAGIKSGHGVAGTVVNCLTSIYATHMLPARSELREMLRLPSSFTGAKPQQD